MKLPREQGVGVVNPCCVRRFEIDAGHRVLGHDGLCRFPHGHRYGIEVVCTAPLNHLGMVIDFGAIRTMLGTWLSGIDHGFLVYRDDHELIDALKGLTHNKVIVVPFNPTAENLAVWMLAEFNTVMGVAGVAVKQVTVYETPNCWGVAT